jgi:hypothetical protein
MQADKPALRDHNILDIRGHLEISEALPDMQDSRARSEIEEEAEREQGCHDRQDKKMLECGSEKAVSPASPKFSRVSPPEV